MTSSGNTDTLRGLFPDAPDDGPLLVMRPRRTIVRARPLARGLYWTAGTTTVLAILMSVGPGDMMVTDLFPDAIASAFWTLVVTILATCMIVYVILRVLHRGLRGNTRKTWSHYARTRGLRPAAESVVRGAPVISGGFDRTFPALYEARLSGCDVRLGAAHWKEGDDNEHTTHGAFFVAARLPDGIGGRWRGTSVTRFFHGSLDFDMDLYDGEELRFESWLADIDCSIKVYGASIDDVRWRELFDPILVDALAHHVDVQWLQVNDWIIACAGGRDQDMAPVETMDTMCLGIDLALAAFRRAAVGDVAGLRHGRDAA